MVLGWWRHHTDAKIGTERTPQKTEVICYMHDLGAAPPERNIDDVQNMATVSTVTSGSPTFGVAVEPRQFVADQLLAKADVIRAMHERVQLCQDPQTEFAVLRQSLGVSRINHILRVHGHPILQKKRATEIYDEAGQRFFDRLFPGFTEDSLTQATLTAGRVRDWIPRHCGSGTPGSTHGSQTAHPGDDTGRSDRWPSVESAPGSSPRCGH